MKIIPGVGTDTITFGMGEEEVSALLGSPEAVTPLGDQSGYLKGRVCWDYGQFDILLTAADGVIAITVDCTIPEVDLGGRSLSGLGAEDLIDWLRQAGETPESGGRDQWGDFNITLPHAGLVFYLVDDVLVSVEVQSPSWQPQSKHQV